MMIPVNAKAGVWSVEARELLSGRGTRAEVTVAPPKQEVSIEVLPDVEVVDAERICKLFARSGQAAIILDEGQKEILGKLVESLKASMPGRWKMVDVLTTDEYEKMADAASWHFSSDGKHEWRTPQGEYQPVYSLLLLPNTSAAKSRLLGRIEAANTAPRRLSANFPGPGRGALMTASSPVRYGEDALILHGGDMEGLEKCVVELSGVVRKTIKSPGKSRREQILLIGRKGAVFQEETGVLDNLFGARIREVAVSSDSRYVAAGIEGWGNNIFILDPRAGRRLAKTVGGRFYPRALRFLTGNTLAAEVNENDNVTTYLNIYDHNLHVERQVAAYTRRHCGTEDTAMDLVYPRRANDHSFDMSQNGEFICAAGNLGLVVWDRSGKEIWRRDFWRDYRTFQDLAAKMTANVKLSPDGKRLALLTQREKGGSCGAKLEIVELPSGKNLSAYSFSPQSTGRIACFDGDQAVVEINPTIFYSVKKEKLVWKWAAPVGHTPPGSCLKAAFCDAGLMIVGTTDGSVIILENGNQTGGLKCDVPIYDVAADRTSRRMCATDSDGNIHIFEANGNPAGKITHGVQASVNFCDNGKGLIVGDWRGNVARYSVEGNKVWETNLTGEVFREDLSDILAGSPDPSKVLRVPPPVREKHTAPEEKRNLAARAQVAFDMPGGWAAVPGVENPAGLLTDGRKYELPGPWLNINNAYWASGAGRIPAITFTWSEPVMIEVLIAYEHPEHRRSIPQEILIEVWKDNAWQPVHVDVFNSDLAHAHRFEAVTTSKLRYSIFADLGQNLWTSEIEIQ